MIIISPKAKVTLEGIFCSPIICLMSFINKQAWKLSAIKGEPNLSILWEVRLFNHIWQKDNSCQKAISVHKASSNLTKVFLAKKHFLLNNNFCQKDISGKKRYFLSEKPLLEKSQFQLKSWFWPKKPILPKK